ncbi:hypothetical protein TRFO_06216 [Tritrichomonas foetus]|uniref:Uncharacterized protein n=1 Tax=Tritrichomonas foetus TaxID=1144522 RepID=A0A1J4K1D4_9EUKA|nr:hypothetical protein TRFO_06216 [Tritrichomonas foetus]|eukprot:OHT04770.1 hypothetical protein TRFO_06216 [Tritrichomonas foetus]
MLLNAKYNSSRAFEMVAIPLREEIPHLANDKKRRLTNRLPISRTFGIIELFKRSFLRHVKRSPINEIEFSVVLTRPSKLWTSSGLHLSSRLKMSFTIKAPTVPYSNFTSSIIFNELNNVYSLILLFFRFWK